MNIMIIGGLGYVGRHLAQQLLIMGYSVTIIDKQKNQSVIDSLNKFILFDNQVLEYHQITLPSITTNMEKIVQKNKIEIVYNVIGRLSTPHATSYMTKFLYCLLTRYTGIKYYIQSGFMEDIYGYSYSKEMKCSETPEKWLAHIGKYDDSPCKIVFIKLPEGYGHDTRLPVSVTDNIWCNMLRFKDKTLDKIPINPVKYQSEDKSVIRNYTPIFDIAGALIDVYGFISNSKEVDFVSLDVGCETTFSEKELINHFTKECDIDLEFIDSIPNNTFKTLTKLRHGPGEGNTLINGTRLFGDKLYSTLEMMAEELDLEKRILLSS